MTGTEAPSGQNAAEGALIDWDEVRALKDGVGDADFIEITQMFFAEAQMLLLRLSGAGDPDAQARDLHNLKGVAANLGLRGLSRACAVAELELETRPGSLDGSGLVAMFERSLQALADGGLLPAGGAFGVRSGIPTGSRHW